MQRAAPPADAAALAPYVPALVAAHLRAGCAPSGGDAPRNDDPRAGSAPAGGDAQRLRATAGLFADISGFTPLCEALRGDNEGLARALNTYVALLGRVVAAEGGDVVAFAGDALIAVWPPGDGDSGGDHGGLRDRVARAGQCALQLQAHLHRAHLDGGVVLSVKVGVGVGDVALLHVGDAVHGRAVVAVGSALSQAFAAEHAAEAGGDVMLSADAASLVAGDFAAPPGEDEAGGAAVGAPVRIAVDGVGTCVRPHKRVGVSATVPGASPSPSGGEPPTSDAAACDALLSSRLLEYVCPLAQPWLVSAHTTHLAMGTSSLAMGTCSPPRRTLLCATAPVAAGWLGQLATASVLFAHLGIQQPQLAAHSVKHAAILRRAFAAVQAAVSSAGGCVNKLLCDDKGVVVVALFGLSPDAASRVPSSSVAPPSPPPLAHMPATAAALCSLDVCARLAALRLTGSVGVARGRVFVGIVGGALRREVTALGDAVNMAARLMQRAGTVAGGGVLCDEATLASASPAMAFSPLLPVAVKGRTAPVLVCQPYLTAFADALRAAAATTGVATTATAPPRRGVSTRRLRAPAIGATSSSRALTTLLPAPPQSQSPAAAVYAAALAAQSAAIATWASARDSPFAAWSPLLARALHAARAPRSPRKLSLDGLLGALRSTSTRHRARRRSLTGSVSLLGGLTPRVLTVVHVMPAYVDTPAGRPDVAAEAGAESARPSEPLASSVGSVGDASCVIAGVLHWRGRVCPQLARACLHACGGSVLALQELLFALLRAGQLHTRPSPPALGVPPASAVPPHGRATASCIPAFGGGLCRSDVGGADPGAFSGSDVGAIVDNPLYHRAGPRQVPPLARAAAAAAVTTPPCASDGAPPPRSSQLCQRDELHLADGALEQQWLLPGSHVLSPAHLVATVVCARSAAASALHRLRLPRELTEDSLYAQTQSVRVAALPPHVQVALRLLAVAERELTVVAADDWRWLVGRGCVSEPSTPACFGQPALDVPPVVGVPAPLLRRCLLLAAHACAALPVACGAGPRDGGVGVEATSVSPAVAAASASPTQHEPSVVALLDDAVRHLLDSGLVCTFVASGLEEGGSMGVCCGPALVGGSAAAPSTSPRSCRYAFRCRITSTVLAGGVLMEQAAPIARCVREWARGRPEWARGRLGPADAAAPGPPADAAAPVADHSAAPPAVSLECTCPRRPRAPRCRLAAALPALLRGEG